METKDEILENLRKDCNRYSAQKIQIFVENGILEWSDFGTIYSDRQLRAIRDWTPLVDSSEEGVDMSQKGIEIYVWGDHGVGKTCFTGAICSVLRNSGMLEPQSVYSNHLCHIFDSNVCTLPMATWYEIHVAHNQIWDERGTASTVYIIEIPSKIGMAMTKTQQGIKLSTDEYNLLEQAMSYLSNSQNYKIHYFLMEYAHEDENKERDDFTGMASDNYLSSIAEFLHSRGVFPDTNTLEVCGLVTKCDRIDEDKASSIVKTFPPSDRPLRAYEYARRSFDSFWRSITDICKNEKIPTICISYSIGKVFAQNLCEFNPSDTAKVIEHLQSLFNRNFFTRLKEKLGLTKRPQRPDYI